MAVLGRAGTVARAYGVAAPGTTSRGYLRSANRNRVDTGFRRSYFGFRVARTLTP